MTHLIAENGSLELYHDAGDDRTPETYTVQHRDEPTTFGSLEVARDWFEITDRYGRTVKLNGSQASTVVGWANQYL